jgi:hypothetical protein
MTKPANHLLLVAAFLLWTGCAHQLNFQVVDASSGRPLAGAAVSVRRVTRLTYFQRKQGPHQIGITDKNGAVTAIGIDRKDDIHFEAPGHFGAVAALMENGKVRINSPFSAPMEPWVSPRQTVFDSRSVINVPLFPKSQTAPHGNQPPNKKL